MASSQVAIITGAASGIGLALTRHLLAKGWRVVMADVNDTRGQELAKESGSNVIFQKTDVSVWEEQAALFKRGFEWGGRIDFLAANAGIADKDDIAAKEEVPKKPNMITLDVDLYSVYYGIKLFAHYARKNKQPGGRVVITGSCLSLYGVQGMAQYNTAKHGLLGLTRSTGPQFKDERIFINAILPGMVDTGIQTQDMMALYPKDHWTTIDAVIAAYDSFLNSEDAGQTTEVAINELIPRKQPEYGNESQRYIWGEWWPKMIKQAGVVSQQVKADAEKARAGS